MKTIEEKSRMLAELRGVYRGSKFGLHDTISTNGLEWMSEANTFEGWKGWWEPYSDNDRGLAQFAAILFRFKEVITRFRLYTNEDRHIFDQWQRLNMQTEMWENIKSGPTQSDFLDEILAMHNLLD